MVRDCPLCKMINPPEAQRCDCGYDFTAGIVRESYLNEKDQARFDQERAKKSRRSFVETFLEQVFRIHGDTAVVN